MTSNFKIKPTSRRVRAAYDMDSIIVYQAFNPALVAQAVELQKFGNLFNFARSMTWIKPSFNWMMHRVGWLHNVEDKRVIRLTVTRDFFYKMLDNAVLSSMPHNKYYDSEDAYEDAKKQLPNRVQWDPGYDFNDKPQNDFRAIQLGIHRSFYKDYNDSIIRIEDITDEARDIIGKIKNGARPSDLLLPEYPYPLPTEQAKRLDMIGLK